MSKLTKIGISLIVLALVVFAGVLFANRPTAEVPLVYSPKGMMDSLWKHYKEEYLEKDTFRTLDKQEDNITTSEGQSYTMLRAVIVDDKATFDAVYKWTNDILKRKEDHLFSWIFGKRTDGSYGVLADQGGSNSASDADSDIALALIFAYNRWHQDYYLNDAKAILKDIWDKEVITINGTPYLTANNVEKFSSAKPIINPSYFAPYAYRIFATVDVEHPWMKLVDSSYKVLNESTDVLPPNWIVIDKKTGQISASDNPDLSNNFSFDALRVPWRIALDYEWNKEPRARAYLDRLSLLSTEWRNKHKVAASYTHDGRVISAGEVPAVYGGVIGYFMVSDPQSATEVYNTKLKTLFNPDTNDWKYKLGYYDSNWAWFGIGIYNHLIQPL